jgi:glycerol kinase
VTEQFVLAIDQGTTNTKALVLGADGQVYARHAQRVGLAFPRPGWAQSDPQEIWHSVRQVMDAALDGLPSRSVVAMGLSNQRESVVAWDRSTGEPLGPVVSWQDNRGADLCAQLQSPSTTTLVAARTGLALDPMFSAAKMRWLLDSIPEGHARAIDGALCMGTVDSWLLWNLTGGRSFATDLTNASRTLLCDLETGEWSADLLELFGIPAAALAEIRPSLDDFGACTTGHGAFASDAVVGAMLGDSHAALVGHGALYPGTIKASFGTGTSVMAVVDAIIRSPKLSSTVGWSRRVPDLPTSSTSTPGAPAAPAVLAHVKVETGPTPAFIARREVHYAIEGNIYATGSALEWTANLLGLHGDVGKLEQLAELSDNSGGVAFVPALAGLGAPYWNPRALGTISGLTRHAGPPEIARAAFEAVGHQVADVVDAIEDLLGQRPTTLYADGGAIRSPLVAQAVADLAEVSVLRADEPEVAALGAARLAAVQANLWQDLTSAPNITEAIHPRLDRAVVRGERTRWSTAIAQTILGTTPGN